MTEKEYRNHPAISRSELWKIEDSPEKFAHYKKTPIKETPALIFGQVFHKLALEEHSFFEEFAVAPDCNRTTKLGKEMCNNFLETVQEQKIISNADYILATEMCQALKSHKLATELLTGEHEKTYFWTDEMTGEPCKSKVDNITTYNSIRTVVDLKSAENADTYHFQRDFFKYGYHLQTAMYSNGVFINEGVMPQFYYVVIEKKPPYAINIVKSTKLVYTVGNDKYRELLGIYHDCKTTNNFYGYMGVFDLENEVHVPKWLLENGDN